MKDWIYANSYWTTDRCNITLQFRRHSAYSNILLQAASGNDIALYVNENLCAKGRYINKYVTDCFADAGDYMLIFESKLAGYQNNIGISFKITEDYKCSNECFDCIENQCCPPNYYIENSSCLQ